MQVFLLKEKWHYNGHDNTIHVSNVHAKSHI